MANARIAFRKFCVFSHKAVDLADNIMIGACVYCEI
jgi:hypothetical protein